MSQTADSKLINYSPAKIATKKILLAHSGKQHSYQVAKALLDVHALDTFYTSSYIRNSNVQQLLRDHTFWSRRFLSGLGGKKVDANWRFEIPEIILRKALGKHPRVQQAVYHRDVNFDNYVSRKLTNSNANMYWGFQGSCYKSLQTASERGMQTVCELATAHVKSAKRILGEEQQLHPEWADSIDNLIFPAAYEHRLEEEPHRADYVVAASDFTRQTLVEDGVSENKIIQLPLGFDMDHIPYRLKERKGRPLKLLYAGTLTQRKGIKYLLEAMQRFKKEEVELHCIGGVQGSGKGLLPYKQNYVYHSPVSQQELFSQYAHYDALVLPTLFEGFGLVIVEAMAAGLPVITTRHSFGTELIQHEHNGYLVPIRDVNGIAEAISQLLNLSDEAYGEMSQLARSAVLDYSWQAYRARLKTVVDKISS